MGIDVECVVTLRDIGMEAFSEEGFRKLVHDRISARGGYFKISSTKDLDPAEVLRRYRQRGIVEQTIRSLKNVTGIKPLRVWSDEAIGGSMILAILSEAVVSMARYCLRGRGINADLRSKDKEQFLPSTKALSQHLSQLTLTRSKVANSRYEYVLSNWTPISKAIFDDLHAHESHDWGAKKIPVLT